jgi:hypothetical protein
LRNKQYLVLPIIIPSSHRGAAPERYEQAITIFKFFIFHEIKRLNDITPDISIPVDRVAASFLSSMNLSYREHQKMIDFVKELSSIGVILDDDELIKYSPETTNRRPLNRFLNDVEAIFSESLIFTQDRIRKLYPEAGIDIRNISRNDPCVCGSDKKFKKCCYSIYS